jgi:hypothetical protein
MNRKALLVPFIAIGTSLGVAYAYGGWDLLADAVTGGAYSATKATVSTTSAAVNSVDAFIKDAKALKQEVENLKKDIEGLGQHARGHVEEAGRSATAFASARAQALRTTAPALQAALGPLGTQLRQDVTAFGQIVSRFASAKDPQAREALRKEAHTVAVRVTQRTVALLHAAKLGVQANMALTPCGADAFANPQAAMTALQPALARLDALNRSVAGELRTQLEQGAQLGIKQIGSDLAAAKSTAVAGLDSVRGTIDFGVKDLTSDIAMLGMLIIEPWRAMEHPLEPIRNTVEKSERAVRDFDGKIQQALEQLQKNVFAKAGADFAQAERAQFAMLEALRVSTDVAFASAQVFACADGGALARLAQATGAQPNPWQPGGGGAHWAEPARFVAHPAPDRVKAALQRWTATHQAGAPHFGQVFAQAAVKRQEYESHLDQAFRGKSPAEINAARAQILTALRGRFGAQKELLAAAEANLDRAIAARAGKPAAPHVMPAAASQGAAPVEAPGAPPSGGPKAVAK